jgi:hypothetical protein
MLLLKQAEELMARWAQLDPDKRRLVLALVRAMTDEANAR